MASIPPARVATPRPTPWYCNPPTLTPWVLCVILTLALGWMLRKNTVCAQRRAQSPGCQTKPLREPGYKLISPLLTCDITRTQTSRILQPLEKTLLSFIEKEKAEKRVTKVSLYFRDYQKGAWVSISENEKYAPASLLKVPVLIAYLKLAETDPAILMRRITYTDPIDYNHDTHFTPRETLIQGRSYTIEELLTRMIKHSDNKAASALIDRLDQKVLEEIYTDLGLVLPPAPTKEYVEFMTVKSYAYFFRVLYNATYLSRAMSEKALALLAGTDFEIGLKAGVPKNIEVAHKFGERTLFEIDSNLKDLHDCGVVYLPEHPYLLCIMTQGYDFETLADEIKQISQMIYADVRTNP